jgi:hypothetical protein
MPVLVAPSRSAEAEEARAVDSGGRPTLEEVLTSAWRELQAGCPVGCPVCGALMQPEPAAAARCHGCGATLS